MPIRIPTGECISVIGDNRYIILAVSEIPENANTFREKLNELKHKINQFAFMGILQLII